MTNATYENFTTLTPNPAAELQTASNANAACGDLSSSTALPASEPSELAHYRIVRVLGQGGMGKVYQAEDMKLQRVVALKVMLPEMTKSPGFRERFLRAARSMAAVRNNHVVTI